VGKARLSLTTLVVDRRGPAMTKKKEKQKANLKMRRAVENVFNADHYPPGELPIVDDKMLREIAKNPVAHENAVQILLQRHDQATYKIRYFSVHREDIEDADARIASASGTLQIVNILPRLKTYVSYKAAQSEKAKLPRGKLGDKGETMRDILAALASEKDELGDDVPPKELWTMLYSELEARGAEPDQDDRAVAYDDSKGGRRTLKRSSFDTTIYRLRKGKS
jgi:hypothetical protein